MKRYLKDFNKTLMKGPLKPGLIPINSIEIPDEFLGKIPTNAKGKLVIKAEDLYRLILDDICNRDDIVFVNEIPDKILDNDIGENYEDFGGRVEKNFGIISFYVHAGKSKGMIEVYKLEIILKEQKILLEKK